MEGFAVDHEFFGLSFLSGMPDPGSTGSLDG
jgi:hypothetical protein